MEEFILSPLEGIAELLLKCGAHKQASNYVPLHCSLKVLAHGVKGQAFSKAAAAAAAESFNTGKAER